MRFKAGAHAVLRDFWHGRLFAARPVTIVEDRGDVVALHLSVGARCVWPHFPDRTEMISRLARGDMPVTEQIWQRNHVLILLREGDAYSPQLFVADDGSIRIWYVNLQDPFKRTPIGFDSRDVVLDIIVGPNLDWWQWKDEHEFAQAQQVGLFDAAEAGAIRQTGEGVIADIERGEVWWKEWSSWEPDRDAPIPVLPDGWDRAL